VSLKVESQGCIVYGENEGSFARDRGRGATEKKLLAEGHKSSLPKPLEPPFWSGAFTREGCSLIRSGGGWVRMIATGRGGETLPLEGAGGPNNGRLGLGRRFQENIVEHKSKRPK